MDRYKEAIECYNIAISKDPTLADTWYNRARLRVRNFDFENGLNDLEQVFRLDREGYMELAAKDEAFKTIRSRERFRKIVYVAE
jgi:tetratricopeptide (TPR) repeat protein